MTTPTLGAIERALDAGKLEVAMQRGAWWKARRNGRTKLWKREPGRFQVPFKAGIFATGRIDQSWEHGTHYRIND